MRDSSKRAYGHFRAIKFASIRFKGTREMRSIAREKRREPPRYLRADLFRASGKPDLCARESVRFTARPHYGGERERSEDCFYAGRCFFRLEVYEGKARRLRLCLEVGNRSLAVLNAVIEGAVVMGEVILACLDLVTWFFSWWRGGVVMLG